MATMPVFDFVPDSWVVNDQNYITKWNNSLSLMTQMQAAINAFGGEVTQELAAALQEAEDTRQQVITDTTAIKNTAVSAAATATTKAAEAAGSAAAAAISAENAQAAAAGDVINDVALETLTTWSSEKISAEISNASTKSVFTQSFLQNQQETIVLESEVDGAALVSVTKEVPQIGVTTDQWDVQVSGANYDVQDTAYSTTLTPSATSGNITLTLGAGAFTADDVGKTISGNGGVAVLSAADGSAVVTTPFTDTTAISSGDWAMVGVVFDDGAKISSDSFGFGDISGTEYDSINFSLLDSSPSGIKFNLDGTKMFIVGTGSDEVKQYSMTSSFDLSTASYDSISYPVTSQPSGLEFSSDGTKMFIPDSSGGFVRQHTLSTPFDLSTASYDLVSFPLTSPVGLTFNNDGTKFYSLDSTNRQITQYAMTAAFDVSTASYDGSQYGYGAQDTIAGDIEFNNDGTKLYLVGQSSDSVHQYSLSTPFELSTLTYDSITLNVASQESQPVGMTFVKNGKKLYIVGSGSDSVHQYSVPGSIFYTPTLQHIPTITNNLGQIDSTFWTDMNSAFATDTLNGRTINYAFSTDGRVTFTVVRENEGARSIARDNAGTWEINTDAVYTGEAWVAAAENSVWGALSEAMDTAANAMNATQLATATDVDFPALGNELDLAIILFTNDATQIPSSQGVTLNYDANVLNQGAVNGTDYEWDQPDNSTVRIKALQANNLKVRVV